MYSDYLADIDGGEFTPEVVNVSNTKLVNFYRKYLLQKALAIYKIKVPETWDINYFRNALFQSGRVCIFRTAKYGVIPQACGLAGYDVFYRPNTAIVTNPCLPDNGAISANAQLWRDHGHCKSLCKSNGADRADARSKYPK